MTDPSETHRLVAVAAALAIAAAAWGCAPGGAGSVVRPIAPLGGQSTGATGSKSAASAFLPNPSRMTVNGAYPFKLSWVDPSVDFTRFTRVAIAPVSLAYMRPVPAAVAGQVDADGRKQAAISAAIRMSDALESAAAGSGTLSVGPNVGAHTVVVATALIQLVPNVTENEVGQAGAQMLVGGMTTELSKPIAVRPGQIAMETILRDGGTHKAIAIFSDTQRPKIPVAAAAPPSKYGFVGPAIDRWAKEIVGVISNTTGAAAGALSN